MSSRTNTPDEMTPGTHGRTVVGLFTDRSNAEEAIRDLKDAGFTDRQIGVAMRDRDEQKRLIEDTGSTAAEGAATGALSGGIVGGLIGLLGSLLIPGVGPIVVGGVLASALTGAGIGAATGGIIGALMGLGVPEEDAQHFDRGLQSGSILVTVDAGERMPEALAILERHDVDLGPSGAARFRDTATTSSNLSAAGTATGATRDLDEQQRIQLREEQLRVEKERVQAGEVRVRKEVITEQQNIQVPVSREEVVIERRAVNDVDASGTPIGGTEEIRVPLSEERVNVEKRPVVREELSVGKRTINETEQVSETVRREEARMETEGDTTVRPLGSSAKPYKGKERRRRQTSTSYSGPERRASLL